MWSQIDQKANSKDLVEATSHLPDSGSVEITVKLHTALEDLSNKHAPEINRQIVRSYLDTLSNTHDWRKRKVETKWHKTSAPREI